jgi:hypothetical protein
MTDFVLDKVIDMFENGTRVGEPEDVPEGTRFIQVSDTLAKLLANKLREHQQNEAKGWKHHEGDPCIHCGTPHDDVKPGPCTGVPMREADVIKVGDLVERPWHIDGYDARGCARHEYKVKDGGNGRLLVKLRNGKHWHETRDFPVEFHKKWQKVTESPAVRFVMLLVEKSKEYSTNKRPRLVRRAIELAIDAQMAFDIDDFKTLRRHYSYWGEYEYRSVIESGNKSAIEALEKYMERTPFWFDDPADVSQEKPVRLYEGARFKWEGLPVKVTTIKDNDNLIACHQYYEQEERTWKTKRVFRISRDDLAQFTLLRQKAIRVSKWCHEQRPLPPAVLSFSKEPGVFVCDDCARADNSLRTGYMMSESTELEHYCTCGKRFYTSPLRDHREAALNAADKMSADDPVFARLLLHALPLCEEMAYLMRIVDLAYRWGILGEDNG